MVPDNSEREYVGQNNVKSSLEHEGAISTF
jgi:hypothetical protein